MRSATLTVRNYRCFVDSVPASFEVGPGFTAFVGQNNAGKSTLLKLFFELRELLRRIGPSGNFQNLLNGQTDRIHAVGVYDPQDLFCDSNDRALQVQIEIDTKAPMAPDALRRANFFCARSEPDVWRAQFFYGQNKKLLQQGNPKFNGFTGDLLTLGTQRVADCSAMFEVARSLSRAIYVGPFRNAINQGASDYYDIRVGNEFVKQWDNWKSGNTKAQNRSVSRVTQDIRHIFGLEGLEISASPDKTTLHLNIDGRPYKLNEVGAGIAQFIIVLGNAMIAQPDYIFIDEPELNLHPALQIDFLTTLGSYAKFGVVFATHSVGLARSIAERIYTFQKRNGSFSVTPFDQTPHYAEFVGEMSFSSFKELGCDQILLVEGVHDVRTLHQFLRKLGKDHTTVVLPLGGDQLARGGVEIELAELGRLSGRIAALVDSERDAAASPATETRRQFEHVCKKLGFSICTTERRAIENYLSDAAIKVVKGQTYRALGPFERLTDATPCWDKGENWRIAREMTFSDIENTDVGQFLKQL